MGSDTVPDSVEWRIEYAIDGLGREMRVSTLGFGEGITDEIRAVEELRWVIRDTIVVVGLLPVRDIVFGDSSGIRGDVDSRCLTKG